MAIHAHFLHNGRILDSGTPVLFAGQIGLLAGWGVFTTLRIARGVPFAWERHWARMERDARLLNVSMPAKASDVERDVLRLIEANGRPDCTCRVVVVRNRGGMWEGPGAESGTDLIALTADSKEWGESVRLGIQPNARFAANEFAGAKILSWGQNLTWAERAQSQGYDEVVLLNERGQVAECTSANIFVASGSDVFTPPLADGCLPGITREVLLEQGQADGVRIMERSLYPDDLYSADEVFITSTTRDLLPVREIAGRQLRQSGHVRQKITTAFRAFVDRDISGRRLAAASR
ncbi:MAG TPA: aminotransferase class IV [Bryobacteraceae bacterium]|nr:aminotransferase class IV [Bryobacteraceae bacterium]